MVGTTQTAPALGLDRIGQIDAFNRLRSAARDNRRKIGEVARELLSTGRLPGERR